MYPSRCLTELRKYKVEKTQGALSEKKTQSHNHHHTSVERTERTLQHTKVKTVKKYSDCVPDLQNVSKKGKKKKRMLLHP